LEQRSRPTPIHHSRLHVYDPHLAPVDRRGTLVALSSVYLACASFFNKENRAFQREEKNRFFKPTKESFQSKATSNPLELKWLKGSLP
jgi:hypothetical protein